MQIGRFVDLFITLKSLNLHQETRRNNLLVPVNHASISDEINETIFKSNKLKVLIFLDQVSIYSNGTVADSRLQVDLDMTGIS